MQRLLLFFLLLTNSYLIANTIATTENHPEAIVEGVNVITGDLYLKDEDLVVQGAEPIHLRRHYISNKGGGYWNLFPYQRAYIDFSSQMVEVIEPSGGRLYYRWKSKTHKGKTTKVFYSIDPKDDLLKGLTNTSKGKPSGKTNLKNQSIWMEKENNRFSVICPDGTKRFYEPQKNFSVEELMDWNISSLSSPTAYLLIKEELPNGRRIYYNWPKSKKDVWEIKTCDASKKTTYAWVRFYPHNGKGGKSHGDYGVETSDGRHLEFSFFSHKKVHQLKQVKSDENPLKIYRYLSVGKRKLLEAIELPEDHFLEIEYYTPENADGLQIEENDPLCFRIKQLISPSGKDSSRVVTHRFIYDLANKKTTVLDAYGIPTEYFWNDDLRLIQINRFTAPGVLYNQERFIWGENQSKDASNLLCKVMFDEQTRPLYATCYQYDSFGNIEKETFYGNLTGQSSFLELDSSGLPLPENESYSVTSSYSQDGKNLLLSRAEENGKSISYTYFASTCLIETETYSFYGSPQKKLTNVWTPSGILMSTREEDLQGNFQLMTQIHSYYESKPSSHHNRYCYPGLPYLYSSFYSKGMESENLPRIELSHTSGGRIAKKTIKTFSGDAPIPTTYSYEKGLLTVETNAQGHTRKKKYDALNRICSEINFGNRLESRITYDKKGRVILKEDLGEGIHKNKQFIYNDRGHKIEEIDAYGHSTRYEVDPFGNISKTHFPNGSVIEILYDAAGNITRLVDPLGGITLTTYNSYNKPTQILYPDKTSEHFTYYKDGNLKEHIDQEQLRTTFEYDPFGRILSKKTPFSEERFSYDSFNLLSKTDAEGNVTYYTYDRGGRKRCEKIGEEATYYAYDAFGRLHRITRGEFSLIKLYNNLDQLTEEKKVDALDSPFEIVSYSYDPAGNLISTKRQVDKHLVEETLVYDALNRIKAQINGEGKVTTIEYDDQNHKEITKDPLGLLKINSFNSDNTLFSCETYSPQGQFLLKELYSYDLGQNIISKQIISPERSTKVLWNYDIMGRVDCLTQAAGTAEEKNTYYSYTKKGFLHEIVKPHVTLTHAYNPLGFLENLYSSDGSVCYEYIHDKTGRLIKSIDQLNGASFSRSYSPQGRISQEIFSQKSNEFAISNFYDYMGRRNKLNLPDNSSILYHHDALYLREVTRVQNDQVSYTHRYRSYDLSGNILQQTRIDGQPISSSYDRMGRQITIDTSLFSEKAIAFDSVGNLLAKQKNQTIYSYTYDDLYQLTSEQGHSYEYDSFFNRTAKDGEKFSSNSLNETSALEYSNGNPTSWKGKKLSYDALDRLCSIEESDKKTFFTYDSFNRRLSKKVYLKDELIQDLFYLYDGNHEIGTFDNFSQKITELRVLGNTSQAERSAAVALELYGSTYVPIHDLQGNVTVLVSLDGSMQEYSYSAFGEENDPQTINPWRFSSKRVDPETGFVYFGQRYYLPELGIFLTQDPLGFEGGANLYAFVSNAPLTNYDLYGLLEEGIKYESFRMQSDDFFFESSSYKKLKNSPSTYTVGTKETPGSLIIFVNGINTTLAEAKQYAETISNISEGEKIHGVYNPKNDWYSDPLHAILPVFGKQKFSPSFIRDTFMEYKSKYSNPDLTALLIGHSDGATQIYNFLKSNSEIAKQFLVLNIAPATIVPKSMCINSFNYKNMGDIIPLILPAIRGLLTMSFWMGQTSLDGPLMIPPARSSNLSQIKNVKYQSFRNVFDHNFDSPTFDKEKKERINYYFNLIRDLNEKNNNTSSSL